LKKALVTGVTGQDGSYLVELLLSKGYEVHGLKRRSSSLNTTRIDHIYQDLHDEGARFFLHYGDLSDYSSISSIISKVRPDEVYNLGAQSHVAVSFEIPEYTADVNGLGTLRVLEAIKNNDLSESTRFYQASSSELFGLVQEKPQKETTPFYPRSPYAAAKLYAYWITVNYREAYGMFACNGILFNHESPRRGETFVTRKISIGLAQIAVGLQQCLYLGNLDARRDWGHARDYVEMQWLMLQQEQANDFVIGSGIQYSVRDFVEKAARRIGFSIDWSGSGVDEVGVVSELFDLSLDLVVGSKVIEIDPRYYRPTEVDTLLSDPQKASDLLGWKVKGSIDDLVAEMVLSDLETARREVKIREIS